MKLVSRLRELFPSRPTVAVIRLYGAIGVSGRFGSALSDHALAGTIERAFRRGKPKAVALAINSPGGSPTQSALIAARIRRLAAERNIPVFAFCEDVAASGGYWLATAADEIWADDNSVIGSIGVISAGFGLQDLIARHGVERRVHTAGQSKSMLDPFRPEQPEDVARLTRVLERIHANFKLQVASRRGAKLPEGEDLFTGDIWIGAEARDKGLIDGVGHLIPVMKAKFGPKTRFALCSPKRSLFQRIGAPGAASLVEAVEDRSLWARYGL
ncbi:S49 family peptidase [Paroceanicella profunda]|uniref:S49 family peptidase n=1 Tax=Paroceanicella profunda TaxID=2579971 RepID=A0A5B8FXF7_9RHOB|nr:S49 family peptidase [Paroceanicella profunda]QDL92294.1 S49 family peptidase [Paroceanicella profunda]